jgi:hypothetical protein
MTLKDEFLEGNADYVADFKDGALPLPPARQVGPRAWHLI